MTLGLSLEQLGTNLEVLNTGAVITPKETLAILTQLYMLDRYELARDPRCAPELLRLLAESDDQLIRRTVAGNSSTPLDVLERLVEQDPKVHWIIASHQRASPQLLEEIAGFTEDAVVLALIARHHNTPPAVLETLARNSYFLIRVAVAQNPRTSSSILTMLLEDPDYYVRLLAAQNPNVPPEAVRAATLHPRDG